MLKILHSSDYHLRDQDISEAEKCLDFMADRAEAEKPDLIIEAGDWFDSRGVKMESPAAKLAFRIVSRLANIAPLVSVIGTASHDGSAPEILANVCAKHQVIIASRPMQVYLFTAAGKKYLALEPHPGIEAVISLCPQPSKQFFQGTGTISQGDQQIGQAMAGVFAGFGAQASQFPDSIHVLVGHFQVSNSRKNEKQILAGNDIEITRGQLELSNANIFCLGHIHLRQEVFPTCFYSGSIYRKDFGELEEKGFYIHKIEKQ